MGEIGETPAPRLKSLELPDISEHAKLAEAAKKEYQSLGATVRFREFPKDALDAVYVWWHGYPETKGMIEGLETVAGSPHLPKLEKRDIGQQLTDIKDLVEPIVSGVVGLTGKERIKPEELSKITERIRRLDDEKWRIPDVIQATALAEALIQTKDNHLDEREIRIRVARGAWEELLNSFGYSRLHYAAETDEEVTTQDALREERDEIISALNRKPWGKRQLEKNRKVYLGLRKRIREDEYAEEILDDLKLVWDSARGAVPSGKSALEILLANERVLLGLAREGAFQWDPEELEEEAEEEEEED